VSIEDSHSTCQGHVSTNILFDEGAQRSFVTEALATQLGANPHHAENLSISSFGGLTTINNTVTLCLKSMWMMSVSLL